jgi:hypothetical protein
LAFGIAGISSATAAEIVVTWSDGHGIALKCINLTTESLETLPQVSFDTRTFWNDGVHQYTGPAFASIAALGPGPVLSARVVGLDGYAHDLVTSDWAEHGAILAVRFDGQYMRIRDKGPFWVMFPADSNPAVLFTKEIQDKLVWHVEKIDFRLDR